MWTFLLFLATILALIAVLALGFIALGKLVDFVFGRFATARGGLASRSLTPDINDAARLSMSSHFSAPMMGSDFSLSTTGNDFSTCTTGNDFSGGGCDTSGN